MALTVSHTMVRPEVDIADMAVGDLIRMVANEVPNEIALVECLLSGEEGASITYSELFQQSASIAGWLLTQYKVGDHVGVWAPNNLNWFLMQLGLSLAGMTLVTINPGFLNDEADYVLAQSESVAVFASGEYRSRSLVSDAKSILASSEKLKVVHDLDEIIGQVLAAGEVPADGALPAVSPNDRCMIQYTSGTTGKPKGATLSHRAVVNYGKFSEGGIALPEGSKWVNFMPMFHTGGCIYMALGCLWNRGQHLLLDGFDPEFVLNLIAKHKANFLWCVPTMYYQMLELNNFDQFDLSSLIVIASGATTVPPELVTRLESKYGAEFVMLFGQTECGMVCQTPRGDTVEHKSFTVGQAMPHVELSIRDIHTNEVKPIGEIGEICLRSVCVLEQYYNNPEATSEAVDKDGWLHMGDLGTMDEDGYCAITGRIKDMIIRGGENIFPREVEDALVTHDDILDAAVFGLKDEKWGEKVVAAIRVRPNSDPPDDELMEYLRQHIARHKVPREWYRVNAFPLTASGKVKKFELQKMFG